MLDLEQYVRSNNEELVNIHWNEIINEYVKKLTASKVLFKKLSEKEYFKSTDTLKGNTFFKEINTEISRYISDSKNPSYQIAIVGAVKAGKSTLINALIGYDLASTNVTPETATLTKIKTTEKNSITVKFYSREEWKKIWNDAQKSTNATIFKEEFDNLKAKEIENQMLGKSDIFKEFDDLDSMKDEIKKWTSSHAREHYFVKEIEIGVEKLNLPPQVCLVDTPGLNDPVQYRSNITSEYIHSANAVIICVNAKTLRNEEITTILEVLTKAQDKKDKIYILGTQIDIMNSQADWEEQQEEWLKHLKEKQFYGSLEMAKEQLIGISSYFYLNAIKLSSNTDIDSLEDVLDNLVKIKEMEKKERRELLELYKENNLTPKDIDQIKRRSIDYSNIEILKNNIQNKLIFGFNESLKIDFINRYSYLKNKIETFKNEHIEKIQVSINNFEQSENELKQQILQNEEQKENLKTLNENLKAKIEEITQAFNTDFEELNKNFKNLMKEIGKVKFEEESEVK